MDTLSRIRERAAKVRRHVVFPEGNDPRVTEAAGILIEKKLARVTLLGNEQDVLRRLNEDQVASRDVEVVDFLKSDSLGRYADHYRRIREEKTGRPISENEALETMHNPLYFGAMMVATSDADTSVAGAIHTTGDVLRSAVRVVGLADGIDVASSSFLMTLPDSIAESRSGDCLLFSDCAIIPDPSAEELVSISLSAAEMWRCLSETEPKLALLSFSTKGSAEHSCVDKVRRALDILGQRHPDLCVDGELQADAALVSEVAKRKAPSSEIAGEANVLIFPNLDAGNIGYKLVERLARAGATGPLIQGLAKPILDLSRGCSANDIVNVASIACVMAGQQ